MWGELCMAWVRLSPRVVPAARCVGCGASCAWHGCGCRPTWRPRRRAGADLCAAFGWRTRSLILSDGRWRRSVCGEMWMARAVGGRRQGARGGRWCLRAVRCDALVAVSWQGTAHRPRAVGARAAAAGGRHPRMGRRVRRRQPRSSREGWVSGVPARPLSDERAPDREGLSTPWLLAAARGQLWPPAPVLSEATEGLPAPAWVHRRLARGTDPARANRRGRADLIARSADGERCSTPWGGTADVSGCFGPGRDGERRQRMCSGPGPRRRATSADVSARVRRRVDGFECATSARRCVRSGARRRATSADVSGPGRDASDVSGCVRSGGAAHGLWFGSGARRRATLADVFGPGRRRTTSADVFGPGARRRACGVCGAYRRQTVRDRAREAAGAARPVASEREAMRMCNAEIDARRGRARGIVVRMPCRDNRSAVVGQA